MTDYNNKNFILAIVLSMAIIFGWQYFYAVPMAERAQDPASYLLAVVPGIQRWLGVYCADGPRPCA